MDGICYDPRLVTFEFVSRLVLRKKQAVTADRGPRASDGDGCGGALLGAAVEGTNREREVLGP